MRERQLVVREGVMLLTLGLAALAGFVVGRAWPRRDFNEDN